MFTHFHLVCLILENGWLTIKMLPESDDTCGVRDISVWEDRTYKSLVKRHQFLKLTDVFHQKLVGNMFILTENEVTNKLLIFQKTILKICCHSFIKLKNKAAYFFKIVFNQYAKMHKIVCL